MGTIIDWSMVVDRYSQLATLEDDSNKVDSAYILPAEYEFASRLAGFYPVPFSSTNLTARDIIIDMVRCRAGVGKERDINAVKLIVDARIDRLRKGVDQMMVSSSNGFVAAVRGDVGGTVWSSTTNYHPTWGHGEVVDMFTDSSQVYAEAIARGEFL